MISVVRSRRYELRLGTTLPAKNSLRIATFFISFVRDADCPTWDDLEATRLRDRTCLSSVPIPLRRCAARNLGLAALGHFAEATRDVAFHKSPN